MRPKKQRRVKTITYANQHRIAAGGRRGGPRNESGRHHPLPHRHGLGAGLRRDQRRSRGAHLQTQTERKQEVDARAVRVGRHGRALRKQGSRHRVRGHGAGDQPADGDPSGSGRRRREPDSRRADARRADSRPRILPPDAPRLGAAHRLDLGQHFGRGDARRTRRSVARDHRRRLPRSRRARARNRGATRRKGTRTASACA